MSHESETRAGYESVAERIEIEIGRPAGLVLDVGCHDGIGIETLRARWPGARVCGIEPDARLVEIAAVKDGLCVYPGSCELMPYPAGTFILVIARHVLEHVADRAAAVAEIVRVLEPGGHCYVQVPLEREGSANPLHVSPFGSHGEAQSLFAAHHVTELYWAVQTAVAELIVRKTSD